MPSISEAVKPTAPNSFGPGVLGRVGGAAVDTTFASASISSLLLRGLLVALEERVVDVARGVRLPLQLAQLDRHLAIDEVPPETVAISFSSALIREAATSASFSMVLRMRLDLSLDLALQVAFSCWMLTIRGCLAP